MGRGLIFTLKFLLLGWEDRKDFRGRSREPVRGWLNSNNPTDATAGRRQGGVSRPEGPTRLILKSAWMCPGAGQAPPTALSTQTRRPAEQGLETLDTRGNTSSILGCPVLTRYHPLTFLVTYVHAILACLTSLTFPQGSDSSSFPQPVLLWG